jgi:hypothetical protein
MSISVDQGAPAGLMSRISGEEMCPWAETWTIKIVARIAQVKEDILSKTTGRMGFFIASGK